MRRNLKKIKVKKGLLVIVSGPSGVGKSTVVNRLLKINPDLDLSVSATTRPPRVMEKQGKDYFFMSEKQFFEGVDKEEFLEWAQVHGAYYGTPKAYSQNILEKGGTVILEVDVQGAAKVKDIVTKGALRSANAVFVFLIPPSVDILAFRLRRRKTEKTQELNYRLRAAVAELQVMEKYDYIVVNDKIESAADKINAIIRVEKERILIN